MTTAAPDVTPFDLAAYLARIDYKGPLQPNAEVLSALHLAHATHIPYENLDILLGKPILLDVPSLQEKLVAGRRGGYCFEQNKLLALALERAGFSLTMLAGRVRYRYKHLMPRTHMILVVAADGANWIADVGFGAQGLLLPIPFAPGAQLAEVRQYNWTFRIIEEGSEWMVQSRRGGEWENLYSFSLEPQVMIDYEMANHYTSTHPDSRFTQTLTAQRMTTEARYIIRNRELTVDRGETTTTHEVAPEEIVTILDETFGLSFPTGTRFFSRSGTPLP